MLNGHDCKPRMQGGHARDVYLLGIQGIYLFKYYEIEYSKHRNENQGQ